MRPFGLFLRRPLDIVHRYRVLIRLVDNESKGEQSDSLAEEEETGTGDDQQGGRDTPESAPSREGPAQAGDRLAKGSHECKRHGASEGVDDDQRCRASSRVRIQQRVLRRDGDGAEREIEGAKDVDLGEPVDPSRVGLVIAVQDHRGPAHGCGEDHRQHSDFGLVHSLSDLGKVLDKEIGEHADERDREENVQDGT